MILEMAKLDFCLLVRKINLQFSQASYHCSFPVGLHDKYSFTIKCDGPHTSLIQAIKCALRLTWVVTNFACNRKPHFKVVMLYQYLKFRTWHVLLECAETLKKPFCAQLLIVETVFLVHSPQLKYAHLSLWVTCSFSCQHITMSALIVTEKYNFSLMVDIGCHSLPIIWSNVNL